MCTRGVILDGLARRVPDAARFDIPALEVPASFKPVCRISKSIPMFRRTSRFSAWMVIFGA